MKTRKSFVSNSSSSSFIIGLNRKPRTLEELKEQMFPGDAFDKAITYIEDSEWSETMSVGDIVKNVFKDIRELPKYNRKDKNRIWRFCRKLKNDDKMILKEILSGAFETMPWQSESDRKKESKILCDFQNKYEGCFLFDKSEDLKVEKTRLIELKKYDALGKKWHKEIEKAARKLWKEKKESFKGKTLYLVAYSDNGGGEHGSFLEHADIFRNIPHITISLH